MKKIPNYIKVLVEQYLQNPGAFERDRVISVHVYHNEWCAIHQGKPCNCDPDIIMDKPDVKDIQNHPTL